MQIRHIFSVFAVTATISLPAVAQNHFTRIKGRIASFDGTTLVIAHLAGPAENLVIPSNAYIIYNKVARLLDIKPGDFVATGGATGGDGKIHAKEVRIFPAVMAGLGEGQYPMAAPKSSMTNATVAAVSTSGVVAVGGSGAGGSSGGTLEMTFHGSSSAGGGACTGHAAPGGTGCTGRTEIVVDPDVPVTALFIGDRSLLQPGKSMSALVTTGPDAKPTAPFVTVEKDGVKPIM